ncbi:tetratricopeptide repeat protein [Aeoliella sp. ICT_H6.2]|uniref:Tetratricopeptide repeat protein n=1 Tax=Aeoliella straminimaris TaxID=2954799 RepID=A0A9X2FDG9_9BACT|nr:tetratricopeptide repeat protein [Aeoliella straminimaris]MCO6047057.1 tetratricopeptide repeat protein [Aeoliella straminimaris]
MSKSSNKTEQARLALEAGDLDEAQRLVEAVLAVSPNNADAHNVLGVIKQLSDDAVGAIVEYKLAASLDPSLWKPFANAAELLYQLGRPGEALPYAEELLVLSQNPAHVRLNGLILVALDDTIKARDCFAEFVVRATEDRDTYLGLVDLSICDFNLGKFEAAAQLSTYAVEILPDEPIAYYWKGLAHEAMQSYDEALKAFTMLIELEEPKDAALHARSRVFGATQEYELEAADLSAAISINPEHNRYYLDRAVCYFHLRGFDLAREDLEVIAGDAEFRVDVHHYRSLMFAEENNWCEALREAEEAHLLAPNDKTMYENLVWLRDRVREEDLPP